MGKHAVTGEEQRREIEEKTIFQKACGENQSVI